MYAKKLKRRCSVRGCKNTVSYNISRSRELGYSVIICEDCLKDAVEAIKSAQPKKEQPTDEQHTETQKKKVAKKKSEE